jgi:hypothetical protein
MITMLFLVLLAAAIVGFALLVHRFGVDSRDSDYSLRASGWANGHEHG